MAAKHQSIRPYCQTHTTVRPPDLDHPCYLWALLNLTVRHTQQCDQQTLTTLAIYGPCWTLLSDTHNSATTRLWPPLLFMGLVEPYCQTHTTVQLPDSNHPCYLWALLNLTVRHTQQCDHQTLTTLAIYGPCWTLLSDTHNSATTRLWPPLLFMGLAEPFLNWTSCSVLAVYRNGQLHCCKNAHVVSHRQSTT